MGRISNNLDSGKANPRFCPICNHPERAEIENAVLTISPSNPLYTLDAIATMYEVSSNDLRVHALMHTPLALDFSKESEETLVRSFQNRVPTELGTEGAASPLQAGVSSDSYIPGKRMSDLVGFRESDMLMAMANEYLTTATALGRRIKSYATDASEGSDQRLAAYCTNAIVTLYLQSGAEMRRAIEQINTLNTSVNGEHDAGAEGLKALADAITGNVRQANKVEE